MKRLIPLAAIFFLVSCDSDKKNQEAEMQLLEQSMQTFNEAFQEGNLQVLDSLTTDSYTHTNSSDRAFGKERWFNYLENRTKDIDSGRLKIDKYQLLEKEVTLYGDAAVVTGLILNTGFNRGEPFSSQIRISNFWIKEEGTWKRAGFHDTRIN